MYRRRRISFFGLLFAILSLAVYFYGQSLPEPVPLGSEGVVSTVTDKTASQAIELLNQLEVKGRAPKTDYARTQFGNGWQIKEGCDMRNTILARDMTDLKISEDCKVQEGSLNDPYTGLNIKFIRGPDTSAKVQIDHVVALSNAWQTGAQLLAEEERIALANDPLNLLAVDGPENQIKGDGDAATWLPKYKPYRCAYIIRQIEVKARYNLWVTPAEKAAMVKVLDKCP